LAAYGRDETTNVHVTANAPSTPAAVPIALGGGGRFVTVERRERDRSQPTLVAADRSADRGADSWS